VRALWERCENGAAGVADPWWLTALDPMLQETEAASFGEAFTEFAYFNLFTGSYADPDQSYVNGADYPRVAMEPVAAPFSDELLRVFYASAQYYAVDAAGRSEMTTRLVVPPGDEGELDGLVLMLAVDQDGEFTAVVQSSDPAAPLSVSDVPGTDRFVTVVVNTQQSGESQRPGLCIGSAAEVEACALAITAAGVAGGAGGGAGGAGAEGGGDTGGVAGAAAAGGAGASATVPPASPEAEDESGCGCRIAAGVPRGKRGSPAGPSPSRLPVAPAALALLGVAIGLGARRRGR
jgi:hypothetical protein